MGVKLKFIGSDRWQFRCAGCKDEHTVTSLWQISDADTDTPTISPSVLVYPHRTFREGVTDEQIDEARKITPLGQPLVGITTMTPRCHVFVRNGMIEYLSDCDHNLAGKVVPMDDFE